MKLNTVLSALVAAGAAFAATSAQAVVFPDFMVNPAPYSAKAPFTADKITGNYDEYATFGAGNTINVSLLFNAGQFVMNDGTTPLTAAVTGLNSDYGLYALFMGSGTFSTVGSVTTFTLNPGSGSFNVFIDQGANNTYANPGANGTTSFVATNPSGPADVQIVQNGAVVTGSRPTRCQQSGLRHRWRRYQLWQLRPDHHLPADARRVDVLLRSEAVLRAVAPVWPAEQHRHDSWPDPAHQRLAGRRVPEGSGAGEPGPGRPVAARPVLRAAPQVLIESVAGREARDEKSPGSPGLFRWRGHLLRCRWCFMRKLPVITIRALPT